MHLALTMAQPTRDISRWSVYNECTNAEDNIIDWLNLSLSTEQLVFTQLLLHGSVTFDGGRVSPVVHEAKSTIVLIFEEVFGGDISEKWC